jgi:predicted Zn-dependent protease
MAGSLLFVPAAPTFAQSKAPRLIRDAEIENTIRAYATPLFQAAGLSASDVHIYLINDSSLNAFVAGGLNLFLHTGLLMRSKNANQVIGVIAHETGHISGGHLARFQGQMKNASIIAILAMIAGAGVAAAGGGDLGAAIMTGGPALATGKILGYSRAQEAAADQAGLSFLDATGQSAQGLADFFRILEGQELLNVGRQDPYMQTHPLTRERVEAVENHIRTSRYTKTPEPAEFETMHKRMIAKLTGFLSPPSTTLARYKEDDPSVAARYARAIAYYRIPDLNKALPLIDGLIAEEPKNPYFYELKGQMLFENGRIADAVAPYERAVELKPDEATLRVGLARAMIERNDPALNKQAIVHLQRATRHEPLNSFAWSQLAIAYGRDNQLGMSSLAQAEAALARNNKREAWIQATRAQKQFEQGSRGWLRSQDIITLARRKDE